MSKHHQDLVLCRKTVGTITGKVCDYCEGRCILCDSQVSLKRKARTCLECSFEHQENRCVVCNSEATAEAMYCSNCCILERDREGCPKVVNMGLSRKDKFIRRLATRQREEDQEINQEILQNQ